MLAGLTRRLATAPTPAAPERGLHWAAVAVVLAPSPDAVLLIRRAERAGDPWSGHMALPGGRHSAGDADLLDTAIRETVEEVGLELSRDRVLGTLPDVVPRIPALPPIGVRPYVFTIDRRVTLVPNAEVASARWVPLDLLLHPETYHSVNLDIRGEPRDVPAYQMEDAVIWGLTERVITQLLDECRAGRV